MSIKVAALSVAACLSLAGAAAGQSAEVAQSASFTSGQVSSGQAVYQRNCGSCHGGSLEGSNDAPALTGSFFLDYWTGKPVADLYSYMHDFMPPAAPGSLEDAQYADIAAYVLSENGFEAGDVELDPEGDLETQIIGGGNVAESEDSEVVDAEPAEDGDEVLDDAEEAGPAQ